MPSKPLSMPPFRLSGYVSGTGFTVTPLERRGKPPRAIDRFWWNRVTLTDPSHGRPLPFPSLEANCDLPYAWSRRLLHLWHGTPRSGDPAGSGIEPWLVMEGYQFQLDEHLTPAVYPFDQPDLVGPIPSQLGTQRLRQMIISAPSSWAASMTDAARAFLVGVFDINSPDQRHALVPFNANVSTVMAPFPPRLPAQNYEYVFRMTLPYSSITTVTDTPRPGFPINVSAHLTTANQFVAGEILYIDILSTNVHTYAGQNTVFVPGSVFVNGTPQGQYYRLTNQVDFTKQQFKRDAPAYWKIGYHSILSLPTTAAVNGWSSSGTGTPGRVLQRQQFVDIMDECQPFGATYKIFDGSPTASQIYAEIRSKMWAFFELGTP